MRLEDYDTARRLTFAAKKICLQPRCLPRPKYTMSLLSFSISLILATSFLGASRFSRFDSCFILLAFGCWFSELLCSLFLNLHCSEVRLSDSDWSRNQEAIQAGRSVPLGVTRDIPWGWLELKEITQGRQLTFIMLLSFFFFLGYFFQVVDESRIRFLGPERIMDKCVDLYNKKRKVKTMSRGSPSAHGWRRGGFARNDGKPVFLFEKRCPRYAAKLCWPRSRMPEEKRSSLCADGCVRSCG